MNEALPHWSEDRYWIDGLDSYHRLRKNGKRVVDIDLQALEYDIYNGESVAYKLMDAMCSVERHEGMEGFKGAPRLLLAVLAILSNEYPSNKS